MKYLLLVLALAPSIGFGAVVSARINAATTSIPTSFAGTNGKALSGVLKARSIIIDNRTAGEIAVNCSTTAAAPGDSDAGNIYVNATTVLALDNANLNGTCWIRSMTGTAISTAIVVLTVLGS